MSIPTSLRQELQTFYTAACRHGLWSAPSRLRRYCGYLFRDVPLNGFSALDVGGGSGVFSLYMAAAGAHPVVCLEPGAAGSRASQPERFAAVASAIGVPPPMLLAQTLQEFEPPSEPFNVILLHNSINHLDEDACIDLRRNASAQQRYAELFSKLAAMLAAGGHLLITDASPVNIWPMLRLRNPFAPSIEWHKHQPPEVWLELAARAGMVACCLDWTSPSSLGWPGRALLGNRLGAFLALGAFRLHLRKASP